MNSKIVKTVDEHNIDRDANVMFAFDLDGSEYVSYSIERDEVQDNLFISKIIKNIDGTFNMLSIDDSMEKSRLNGVVMSLVEDAVHNAADKLHGDTVTLSDGKVVKFKTVSFHGGGWNKSIYHTLLYYRGAAILIKALLNFCIKVRTSCLISNKTAYRFLKSIGFVNYLNSKNYHYF